MARLSVRAPALRATRHVTPRRADGRDGDAPCHTRRRRAGFGVTSFTPRGASGVGTAVAGFSGTASVPKAPTSRRRSARRATPGRRVRRASRDADRRRPLRPGDPTMTRPPVLPTRPAPFAPFAPRALAAAPRATAPAAEAALPRTPVLQHGRAPRQLSFAFHRP
jgi:hypothetical protein